jgi:heme O synthase-like polyprenyltransferase
MKRSSSFNTIVGAVAGAFPPLIGWSAGGGSILGAGAAFLFLLLFFWQLPHFAAINWMYREEYVRGGFVMWSNDDEEGKRTATLALVFSLCLVGVGLFGMLGPGVNLACSIGIMAAGGYLSFLSYRFLRSSLRTDARRLFFFTLMYLPLVLVLGYLGWSPIEHGS